MATIKSYTDLDQSRKLAEILPLESADMFIGNYVGKSGKVDGTNVHYYPKGESFGAPEIIEAWSLAALLGVIPDSIYDNTNEFSQLEFSKRSIAYHDLNDGIKIGSLKDNLIDACYEVILKLHELNLL